MEMQAVLAIDQAIEKLPQEPNVHDLLIAIAQAKQVKFLTIYNSEQTENAAKNILALKDLVDRGEAMGKEIRDPYTQMSKRIKASFDEWLAPVRQKITEGNKALSDYRFRLKKKEEEERRKAQEKLDKEREKALPEVAEAMPEKAVVAPKTVTTKTEQGTIFEKKELVIDYDNIDIKILAVAVGTGAVPVGVFEVKRGFVKSLIKGGMKLPGVESWEEDGIGTRKK